jgi:hypothetical protein
MEVHAAAFLKKREMFMESALLDDAPELLRIFTHEMFHFVWRRLDNESRRAWDELLRREHRAKVKGELGWSAELAKQELKPGSLRRWKDYVCESFCDTAAWFFSNRRHPEFTLAVHARRVRARWFRELLRNRRLPL